MKIPTWGWVLITLTLITIAIIAFRKPLKAWVDKRKATATKAAASKPGLTTASTVVSESESTLSKMRRVA